MTMNNILYSDLEKARIYIKQYRTETDADQKVFVSLSHEGLIPSEICPPAFPDSVRDFLSNDQLFPNGKYELPLGLAER